MLILNKKCTVFKRTLKSNVKIFIVGLKKGLDPTKIIGTFVRMALLGNGTANVGVCECPTLGSSSQLVSAKRSRLLDPTCKRSYQHSPRKFPTDLISAKSQPRYIEFLLTIFRSKTIQMKNCLHKLDFVYGDMVKRTVILADYHKEIYLVSFPLLHRLVVVL